MASSKSKTKTEKKEKKEKKGRGNYSRQKGHRYELKIIKELNTLYNTTSLVSSRSESKRTDDAGVDIVDKDNILSFYVQCKNTQATPNPTLIDKCKLKDKPLVIFWNKQVKKETNCISEGEFVMMKKDFFYEILNKIEKEDGQI